MKNQAISIDWIIRLVLVHQDNFLMVIVPELANKDHILLMDVVQALAIIQTQAWHLPIVLLHLFIINIDSSVLVLLQCLDTIVVAQILTCFPELPWVLAQILTCFQELPWVLAMNHLKIFGSGILDQVRHNRMVMLASSTHHQLLLWLHHSLN